MIWYSHLSKSFPQFVMTYIVKGFSVVNETEIDVLFFFFLKFPCFLYNPTNVGNLISNSSSFSKHSSDIWNFSVCIMQKPSIQNFGLDGKESACNMGDLCLTPGLGRSPEGGHGKPLQYSCLEKSMDRGAWQAIVHGVTKSQTQLRN